MSVYSFAPQGPRNKSKSLTFWDLDDIIWTKMGQPKGQKVGFEQLSLSQAVPAVALAGHATPNQVASLQPKFDCCAHKTVLVSGGSLSVRV